MRRSLAVAALLLAASPSRAAEVPKAELFGGYSFTRFDTGTERKSLNGWEASLGWELGSHMGLVADLSGHYGHTNASTKATDSTFMAGPRFALRARSATVFVYGLAGGAQRKETITPIGDISISEGGKTELAWAVGGGLDVRLSERWAARAQGDYFAVRSNGANESNPRLAAGVVYRIGRR